MRALFNGVLVFFSASVAVPAWASPPVPGATVRVPQCLQFPDSKTYTPCTGVVPADSVTGNALDWNTLIKGSPTNPVYNTPVINGSPVTDTNPSPTKDNSTTGIVGSPVGNSARLVAGKDSGGNTQIFSTDPYGNLNVNCIGCTGGGGGVTTQTDRRSFWSESSTPLVAGDQFVGTVRDSGGTAQGVPTKWNSFGCFVATDQSGTVLMQASNTGTSWFTVQSRVIGSSGASIYLGQSLFTRYWRCTVINGSTAQTSLVLNSTFGM